MKKKKKNGKVNRDSVIDSSLSSSDINKFQEEIREIEAPLFNSFLRKQIVSENDKSSENKDIISQLYYLKILNIDINFYNIMAL